ncbi:MAG TPA: SprT family zinc-dependent metalloprotease [Patescibacteria group bacterium]|nr:SprT family zinc-dependent metalloprotease [Patescibacteria group bacterium]
MSVKSFSIDGIGIVAIHKRRGSKRLNLRIDGQKVRVTQPPWLPYANGVRFASSNKQWILIQRQNQPITKLIDGMAIGKNHTLIFQPGASLRTRVAKDIITVFIPPNLHSASPATQKAAQQAAKKALKIEAEELLGSRLSALATKYGFTCHDVKFKSMHSKWGSCNNKKVITISIYLMMVPWELIDYVLLHELAHTQYLHHGKDFWATIEAIMPDYKARRKRLKELQYLVAPLK